MTRQEIKELSVGLVFIALITLIVAVKLHDIGFL